ncbi:MAG TPA: hypothetical protein VHT51_02665 [Micropepsaceae bacterium]|jgi:hypothetical protein|nr:hypothetical protein [Micropepsaceae bacterium]
MEDYPKVSSDGIEWVPRRQIPASRVTADETNVASDTYRRKFRLIERHIHGARPEVVQRYKLNQSNQLLMNTQ